MTDSEHRVVAFTVDDEYVDGDEFLGRPLVPFSQRRGPLLAVDALVLRGALLRADEPRPRRSAALRRVSSATRSRATSARAAPTSASKPRGPTAFILEDNTVQPFVRIGANVTLWSGNHIGHDSTIEDDVFVSSQVVVSGHCRVVEGCFLGVNSTVQHGVRLASEPWSAPRRW